MGGATKAEEPVSSGSDYDQRYEQGGSPRDRDEAYQQAQEEFSHRQKQRQEDTANRAREKAAQAKRKRAAESKAQKATDDFFEDAWKKEAEKKAQQKPPPKQEEKPPPKDSPPKSEPKPKFREWWEVLGVSPTATLAEIKKARNAKAMQFHSDKIQHMSETFKNEAEEELKAINGAFEIAKKRRK